MYQSEGVQAYVMDDHTDSQVNVFNLDRAGVLEQHMDVGVWESELCDHCRIHLDLGALFASVNRCLLRSMVR